LARQFQSHRHALGPSAPALFVLPQRRWQDSAIFVAYPTGSCKNDGFSWKPGKRTDLHLINFNERFVASIRSGQRARALSVGLLAGCLLLVPASAKADTTFNVAGNYTFPGSGTFSGTLTVNTASGALDAVDITFGRTLSFNSIFSSLPGDNFWTLSATNKSDQELLLGFSAVPTAASLVGMTSANIVNGTVIESAAGGAVPVFGNFSGTITAAVSAPPPSVPEPSSLALLALGLLLWLPFRIARFR
jgi:hypothetical protein